MQCIRKQWMAMILVQHTNTNNQREHKQWFERYAKLRVEEHNQQSSLLFVDYSKKNCCLNL